MYEQSPFVVDSLRPETLGGSGGRVYQLTAASASPTRIIGRDEVGMPIEDTVPAAKWLWFVHPCGAPNKVPMHTAVAIGSIADAEKYEIATTRNLIASGWIPLWVCPYTFEYKHVTGGPFVKVPEGESDCGGHPEGCSHLKAVMRVRTERALKKHGDEEARLTRMRHEDTERLVAAMSEGVGQVLARHADPRAAKKAQAASMATGRGEE